VLSGAVAAPPSCAFDHEPNARSACLNISLIGGGMQHAVHLQSKFGCTPQGHKPGVAGVRGTAWPTTDCTWTAPPVGTLQITGQTRLSQPIYDPSLAAWCVHTADHGAGTAGVRGARRLGLHPALHDVPRGWHLLCRGARLGKAADRLDRPLPSRVCACVCVCMCLAYLLHTPHAI